MTVYIHQYTLVVSLYDALTKRNIFHHYLVLKIKRDHIDKFRIFHVLVYKKG